ncbi:MULTISPECIES: hypothetical protein [Rhodomicrobium]|uniref:hypothetical protein n=1 Tax=Rhodomicrobium TaxID=1068 RepID=UPI000B4B6A5E|nr:MULTISPECIES: hypothetical protein [Rhodomicrobium]
METGRAILAALALVPLLASSPARAHHPSRAPAYATGLPIPNLVHGQMAVIARYRSAILNLADRQAPTDDRFRRLRNFANIQYSYCLWGLAPGSVADEESPFNECAHAYLAATQALLLHMREMPRASGAVQALVAEIDMEMLRDGASLILCRYSGEAFNTGEIVKPRWAEVVSHPPSIGAFAAIAAALAALLLALRLAGRDKSAKSS